jgi:hypothetical protein
LFPQSYQTILNKQEFIIHNSVTQPVQYSLSTLPTMSTIYDKLGAGWSIIDSDNYFTNYYQTNEIGNVVQQEIKSTSPQQFEEDHITLMTMRHFKAVCSKSNERKFVIQCVMDEYKESNATIRSRHQKLFKDYTYKFEASMELVTCMPFDFIDGLKDNNWTHIDHEWLARLMKHLKKAQSSNIKQIRFVRHIRRLDIYDNSREYVIVDNCYIYEVILENNLTHYVSFGQINDIIGDEEWLQGEGNCLYNIASS